MHWTFEEFDRHSAKSIYEVLELWKLEDQQKAAAAAGKNPRKR